MRSASLFAVVLMAFFTISAARAQVFTCTFQNGASIKIDDHYDGDLQKQPSKVIDYYHYNPTGQKDLHLTAVAMGWANQNHMITEYYRFQSRDYNYIALHDGAMNFDGLKVYKGSTLVAKQACTNGGWSPALDPTNSVLPNDMDGDIADTYLG